MSVCLSLVICAVLCLSPAWSWPGYGRLHPTPSYSMEEKLNRAAYKHAMEWDDQLDGSYDLASVFDQDMSEAVQTATLTSEEGKFGNSDMSLKSAVVPRATEPKKGPRVATIHDEVPLYLRSDSRADISPTTPPPPPTPKVFSWTNDDVTISGDDGADDKEEVEIMLGPSEIDPTGKSANLGQSAFDVVTARSTEDAATTPENDDDDAEEEEEQTSRVSLASEDPDEEEEADSEAGKVVPIAAPPTVAEPASSPPPPAKVESHPTLPTAPPSHRVAVPPAARLVHRTPVTSHLADSPTHLINENVYSLQGKSTDGSASEKSAVLPIVFGSLGAVLVCGLIGGVFYRRHSYRRKMSSYRDDAEDPAYGYGITGPISNRPSKGSLDFQGDRLLAKSAEALQFQAQKRLYIQSSSSSATSPAGSGCGGGDGLMGKHSDYDSEEEEEDGEDQGSDFGDYTVYECPGLAPASDSFEVVNPLFSCQDGHKRSSLT